MVTLPHPSGSRVVESLLSSVRRVIISPPPAHRSCSIHRLSDYRTMFRRKAAPRPLLRAPAAPLPSFHPFPSVRTAPGLFRGLRPSWALLPPSLVRPPLPRPFRPLSPLPVSPLPWLVRPAHPAVPRLVLLVLRYYHRCSREHSPPALARGDLQLAPLHVNGSPRPRSRATRCFPFPLACSLAPPYTRFSASPGRPPSCMPRITHTRLFPATLAS